MRTLRTLVLGCLSAVVLATACGQGIGTDDQSAEMVAQRLDNNPGEAAFDRTRYPAELSGDGKNYCAKDNPSLCAPARAARQWACTETTCGPRGHETPCTICCLWVPGSWPFDIECGKPYDFP
jgi:hypothetical protein